MEWEIVNLEERMVKLRIVGEDYTLGNLLQEILLRDKRVKGAGFIVPHPLKKELVMTITLKKGNPFRILKENIEKLNKYMNAIKTEIESAMEDGTEA